MATSRPTTAGSVLRFGRHRLARVWLSRPLLGRGRFPKAPGSRSRTYGRRIGQTGRRTAGRSTSPPSEMDTDACGASVSTPVSHRPVGEAFVAWHFHGRESYAYCCQDGWSAAAGRIAIALKQDTGNIWLMSHAWHALTVHCCQRPSGSSTTGSGRIRATLPLRFMEGLPTIRSELSGWLMGGCRLNYGDGLERRRCRTSAASVLAVHIGPPV